jgi:hypothetical protein
VQHFDKRTVQPNGVTTAAGAYTRVLFRCDECRSPWTDVYRGTWTLDELFGPAGGERG